MTRALCVVKDCGAVATQGGNRIATPRPDRTAYDNIFCHPHWFMMPAEIRKGTVGVGSTLRHALAWHEEAAGSP